MTNRVELYERDGLFGVKFNVRRCKKCVISETFPDADFDFLGLCGYCRESENLSASATQVHDVFADVKASAKGCDYDIVHLMSGGKDSTFALHQLVEHEFRPLAMTYDNGFIAPEAIRNIRRTSELLGVECIVRKLNSRANLALIRAGIEGHQNEDALKYSTAACGICISTVLTLGADEAHRRGIKFMSGGWTPGQFTENGVVDSAVIAKVCRGHFGPLALRDAQLKAALTSEGLVGDLTYPRLMNPMYFLEYSEASILAALQDIGWEKPKDTDSCSTNCLLNGYLVLDHILRHEFHPYEFELAHHVRTGRLEREDAIIKMTDVKVSRTIANSVEKSTGISLPYNITTKVGG